MGKSKTTITINGKVYDAITGQPVVTAKKPDPAFNSAVRQPAAPATAPRTARQHDSPKAQNVHHKQGRSQTLMRTMVQKPAKSIKAMGIQSIVEHKSRVVKPKRQLKTSQALMDRAAATPKSKLVAKFAGEASPVVVRRQASIPVKLAPSAPPPTTPTLQTTARNTNAPATQHTMNDKETILARGLARASSHEQKPQPLKTPGLSRRSTNIGAALLTVLVLGAFFAYQNMPRLTMRVAAARAGMAASLPGYKPAGFSQNGSITYSPGKVAITYQSNSDDRAFTLTQSKSSTNESELAANINNTYQTIEGSGRKIFVYGGSNATWTHDGILYQIEGKSGLSNDQILRLTASL